jgi:hypothetical protein
MQSELRMFAEHESTGPQLNIISPYWPVNVLNHAISLSKQYSLVRGLKHGGVYVRVKVSQPLVSDCPYDDDLCGRGRPTNVLDYS